MSADPFGRAIRDHYHGEQSEPLVQRDGHRQNDHPIEAFYFDEFTRENPAAEWLSTYLDGPLLDVGAGVGRHALYFQQQFETVPIEVSDHLVSVMCDRGVEGARRGDMFALREAFERDRFRSVFANGTQMGLVGSMAGLRELLADIAHVTDTDGTAVVDSYDPTRPGTADLLGYRSDPTPGLAFRVMSFEYEGDVGDILQFRLFSPDRVREATVGTDWTVDEVRYGETSKYHYQAALVKR